MGQCGSATSTSQLCSNKLCIPSGPGDLCVGNFCNFLVMESTLKSALVSLQSDLLSVSTGISLVFSAVNISLNTVLVPRLFLGPMTLALRCLSSRL